MPRTPDQNALVRETRKKQILDAALTLYVRFGYHGTDMDMVAREAKLAKGLIYYYYKTKQELLAEVYAWMMAEAYAFSDALLKNGQGLHPVEQLVRYAYGMFCANQDNPRLMAFSMRLPFDAYAIFGPETWREGVRKSDLHRRALTEIIEKGVQEGSIPACHPGSAANSFWTVFVANVFEYSKLIAGAQMPPLDRVSVLRDVVQFCFQGLGIAPAVWHARLDRVVSENREGGSAHEGVSGEKG